MGQSLDYTDEEKIQAAHSPPGGSDPEHRNSEGVESCSAGGSGVQQEAGNAASPSASGRRAHTDAAVLHIWTPDHSISITLELVR